jgi:hypothetical protein
MAILLLLTPSNLTAQTKTKKEKKFSDKLFFGGSIGMVFGTVTRIDILPEAGMWLIPQWAIGIGGRYTFRKERFNMVGGEIKPYKAHIWGFSGFTQILPIPDLDKKFHIGIKGGPIFYGEWEGLYLDKGAIHHTAAEPQGKGWVHMFLFGGGYRIPLGDKAALNLLVLWDLTNNTYSPYTTNPLLRLSISF